MDKHKTITQLFEEYIKECQYSSRLRPATIKGYTEVFKLFLLLMPEVQDSTFLTTEMLTQFFKRLQIRERMAGKDKIKIGVTDSTIKTYCSKLNAFLNWLTLKGIINKNPLENIKPPQPVYEDIRTLKNEDVRKLYAAITLHSTNRLILRRDTVMVSLLLFCGLRLGEFISLEVRDIDFEKQLLTVRGTTSKSRKIRLIPIHPTLLFHLKDYVAERNKCKYTTQYLIISSLSDTVLSRHGLKHWVKSLGIKSGVKFHLHRFRHTFASNLAEKNVSAVKIQKLLGHGSLNMTMTYLRSTQTENMKEDINKLSV